MNNLSVTFYYYPDGTIGKRPKDGERFISAAGNNWQWDNQLTKWVREYGGNHTTHKPGDAVDFSKNVLDNYDNLIAPIVCECGKDNHGFARHAEWCKKAELEW